MNQVRAFIHINQDGIVRVHLPPPGFGRLTIMTSLGLILPGRSTMMGTVSHMYYGYREEFQSNSMLHDHMVIDVDDHDSI